MRTVPCLPVAAAVVVTYSPVWVFDCARGVFIVEQADRITHLCVSVVRQLEDGVVVGVDGVGSGRRGGQGTLGCLFGGCALLLVSAGCVTGDPDVSVLDATPLSASHAAREAGVTAAPTPAQLGDVLKVDGAVRIALSDNPDIGQALARLRGSAASLKRARALLLPRVDASGTGSHYIESSMASGPFEGLDDNSGRYLIDRGDTVYRVGLGLSWTLFSGGRNWETARGAADRDAAVRLETARVDEIIANAVRSAYHQALLARESIAIAEASEAFSARELKDARARLDVGRGLKTDVLTFETKVFNAQVDVAEAENAYRLARIALAQLMARSLPEDVALVMPQPGATEWERKGAEDTVAAAWAGRPDLAALRERYSAALRDVRVARSRHYPDVNASVNYTNSHLDSLGFEKVDDDVTAGVSVAWNLYSGGETVAAVRDAEASATQAAEAYRELKLTVQTEIASALANVGSARRRIGLAQKAVDTAEETLQLLTERYRAGALTISQVTEGELRLTEARQQLVAARIDLLEGLTELKLATGTGERASVAR